MSTRVKRVEFTRDMRDYTILCPDMLPVHFALLEKVFRNFGYNLKVLKNQGRSVVESGLRNVHNDTCYPALLVIGQLIDALESGEYDINRVALMITQTNSDRRRLQSIQLYTSLKKGFDKVGVWPCPRNITKCRGDGKKQRLQAFDTNAETICSDNRIWGPSHAFEESGQAL